MKTLKRLFSYYKPYMSIIILYVIMGIIMVLLAMLIPMITKHIIASVIGDAPFSFIGYSPVNKTELLWVLIICWILLVVLRQGISYLRTVMILHSSIDAVTKMRIDFFSKMLWQSQSFLRQENTGNLITVLSHDTEMVKNFFTTFLPAILEAFLGFAFASIILFKRNPKVVDIGSENLDDIPDDAAEFIAQALAQEEAKKVIE